MIRNHGIIPKESRSKEEYYGSCDYPIEKDYYLEAAFICLCITAGIFLYIVFD